MFNIVLDIYQSTALGAIVLVLGLYLLKKSKTLQKFCIPAAVAGGLVFSLVNAGLHYGNIAEFQFDETMKNVFMMAFFCSVGFMASFRMLKTGGKLVIILLALVAVMLTVQDIIGPVMVSIFGLDPKYGLCLGSISLVGGHGTSASYGELLVTQYGLTGADTIAIASATFGLAISGFLGGPLARRRIEKHGLAPDAEDLELAEKEEEKEPIENNRFLVALVLMVLCIGAGTYVCQAITSIGVTVPVYIGAMLLALIIRNACDKKGYKLPVKEISTLGWISLTMFLSMALMSMKLWQIADLAGVMIITLIAQLAFVGAYAYFVIFRFTGRNYDSAALVAATCGFGLGATPNAIANMEAMMERHGPAPTAYFVVPLVGSVFIDLVNSGVLTVFLNIL